MAKKLKKLEDGSKVNQYGVIFSEEEYKTLVARVNSANRKQKRLKTEQAQLDKYFIDELGYKTHQRGAIVEDDDFIMARKHKSLQKFKSKDAYYNYISNLERVLQRNYIENRTSRYKENYIKGIKGVMGDIATPLIEKLDKIKGKDFNYLVATSLDMRIPEIYLYRNATIEELHNYVDSLIQKIDKRSEAINKFKTKKKSKRSKKKVGKKK